MKRKALWKTGSNCPAMTCLVLKLTAFTLFFSGLLHAIYYVYNINTKEKFKRSLYSSTTNDDYRNCEFTQRIVTELQSQLKEKEKLLQQNAKEMETLKTKLLEYNSTTNQLKETLRNLTEVLRPNKKVRPIKSPSHPSISIHYNSTAATPAPIAKHSTMPFPGDFKDNVERVNRPCCLALKRMTDILRMYMEKTQDLRDEIKYYQDLNNTDNTPELSEEFKQKVAFFNCTRQFYQENKNWTIKTGKHSIYQAYYHGFFYESATLNRDIPKQKSKSKTSHRTLDFQKVSSVALSEVVKHTSLRQDLFEVDDALLRYDELAGAEYKLSFKYNKSRTFLINLIKPFGTHIVFDKVAEQRMHEKELINIIVPITGRTVQLTNFLRDISNAVLKHKENIFLTVVIYGKDPENKIKSTVKRFSLEHNFGNYDVLKKDAPFNRGRALHDGIMRWNGYNNVLLFLCDIDIKFNQPFLERCRKYTESGKTVYMPIVFSLYNPNIVFDPDEVRYANKALNISENTGTWRPLGYGMVCAYKMDYLKTHGFNLAINGWGGEDVSLYHR